MDARLRRFRKEAGRENRGRRGVRLRYSKGLRREAVAYLKKKRRLGLSVERVASELGVSGWSLTRWSREMSREEGLRPVEVLAESRGSESDNAAVLVTPEGYRVEGVDWRRIPELLEVLR